MDDCQGSQRTADQKQSSGRKGCGKTNFELRFSGREDLTRLTCRRALKKAGTSGEVRRPEFAGAAEKQRKAGGECMQCTGVAVDESSKS